MVVRQDDSDVILAAGRQGQIDEGRAGRNGNGVTLVLPGWVRTNVSINALTGSGAPNGKMEEGTAGGVTSDYCAQKIIAAASLGKREVAVVRFTEQAALYLSRFTPRLFARMIRDREL